MSKNELLLLLASGGDGSLCVCVLMVRLVIFMASTVMVGTASGVKFAFKYVALVSVVKLKLDEA